MADGIVPQSGNNPSGDLNRQLLKIIEEAMVNNTSVNRQTASLVLAALSGQAVFKDAAIDSEFARFLLAAAAGYLTYKGTGALLEYLPNAKR